MSFSAWCIRNPIELEALNTLKSSQLLGDKITNEGERIWARVFTRLEQGMTDKVITTAPVGLITASIEAVVQSVATYAVQHKLPDPMVEKLTKRSFDLFWKGITL
jgi:ethanolamine ammonia-lyase large subunit